MRDRGEVAHLLRLVLKCSLLGNFPRGVRQRLAWAGRVRLSVHLTDTVPSTDALGRWIDQRPFLIMFALREWLLDTCEAGVVVDHMLLKHPKWADFKRLSRYAMDQVRRELSLQAADNLTAPTRWEVIETPPPTRRGSRSQSPPPPPPPAPLTHGLLNRLHRHVLSCCQKARKGLAHVVIRKKLTSEEPRLLQMHVRDAIAADPDGLDRVLRHWAAEARRDVAAGLVKAVVLERSEVQEFLQTPEPEPTAAAALSSEQLALLEGIRAEYARLHADPSPVKWVASHWDPFRAHVLETIVLAPIRARFEALSEVFHTVARHVVQVMQRPDATTRERETPQLRWLHLLGLHPDHVEEIRIWFYRYTTIPISPPLSRGTGHGAQ